MQYTHTDIEGINEKSLGHLSNSDLFRMQENNGPERKKRKEEKQKFILYFGVVE